MTKKNKRIWVYTSVFPSYFSVGGTEHFVDIVAKNIKGFDFFEISTNFIISKIPIKDSEGETNYLNKVLLFDKFCKFDSIAFQEMINLILYVYSKNKKKCNDLIKLINYLYESKSELNEEREKYRKVFRFLKEDVTNANLFNAFFQKIKNETIIVHSQFPQIYEFSLDILKNNRIFFFDHGLSYIKNILNNTNKAKDDVKKYREYAKQIILLTTTNESKKIWEKYYEFKEIYVVPFGILNGVEQQIPKFEERKYILGYLGRYDQRQKNISLLNDIAENTKSLTLFRGYDDYFNPGKNFLISRYAKEKGELKGDKSIFYNKIKYFILVSNFEGFSFVLSEALSYGVPLIVLDRFPSAKYLIGKNNERGFLAKNLEDITYFIKNNKNNKTLWEAKHNNAIEFADKNLTFDNFIEKIQNILDGGK